MIARDRMRGVVLAALTAGLAAGLGKPPAAAAESGCGASYTVQSGDTLAAIAKRCGTSVHALMQANPVISDPARISIGWELTIPGARASLGPDAEVRPSPRSEAAQAALAAGSYEVQPGDSFASIATALQIPMQGLIEANKGVDPFAPEPGQVLYLPPAGVSPEPVTAGGAKDTGAAGAQGGAPAEVAAQPAEAAPAAQGPTETGPSGQPSRAVERVALEGRVERGAECPVLKTPGGKSYSLVSTDYVFAPGEYVQIEGETVERTFCGKGRATVRVTSMTPMRSPQGG